MQLHVVEELLELFGIDTVVDSLDPPPLGPTTETVMEISRQALTGGIPPKTFQLHAWMQGREVLMLVDSGSSTSFVDQHFAQHLQGVQDLIRPCRVKVADGGELCCYQGIPDCVWTSQGCEFSTDMKILPLGTYNAILGMDWLESHSPMTVDWKGKSLVLTTPAGPAFLRGHASSAHCLQINSVQMMGLY